MHVESKFVCIKCGKVQAAPDKKPKISPCCRSCGYYPLEECDVFVLEA